jgi:hypothetical protein
VAVWAAALASLAREGSVVHRVQWVCRSVPNAGPAPAAWPWRRSPDTVAETNGHGAPSVGGSHTPASAAERSYAALLEEQAGNSNRHEILICVSIHARKSFRAVKASGGGHLGACSLALREAGVLRRRLGEAGIHAGAVLGVEEVGLFIRSSFGGTRDMAYPSSEEHAGSEARGRRPAWPWPMGARAEWGRARIDGGWHATYWVSEWPRTEVGPDFLGPLLLLSSVSLSVAVVMQPVGPIEAARKLEQARTADIADSELRRRGGFLATARRRREEQVLAERELEIADGHAPFRFSGYVTVSALEGEELEEACTQVEQAGARSGLELRMCYGDQLQAFTTTLPLCRGLS